MQKSAGALPAYITRVVRLPPTPPNELTFPFPPLPASPLPPSYLPAPLVWNDLVDSGWPDHGGFDGSLEGSVSYEARLTRSVLVCIRTQIVDLAYRRTSDNAPGSFFGTSRSCDEYLLYKPLWLSGGCQSPTPAGLVFRWVAPSVLHYRVLCPLKPHGPGFLPPYFSTLLETHKNRFVSLRFVSSGPS